MLRARQRRRDLGCLVACVALVLAACGGEADTDTMETIDPAAGSPETSVGYEEAIDPDVLALAQEIGDRLGRDDGFAAVVGALDAGYRVVQIRSGASDLQADGTISGVAPEEAARGVFAAGTGDIGGMTVLAAAVDVFVAAKVSPQDLHAALERKEKGELFEGFLGAVVALVDVGYSLEQIVDGLVFGEARLATIVDPDNSYDNEECIVLAERDGTLIAPEDAAQRAFYESQDCADVIRYGDVAVYIGGERVAGRTTTTRQPMHATTTTTAPAASVEALPRIYRGDGLHRITFYDSALDSTMICENDVAIELRLETDGSAVFTYSPGMGMHRDGDDFECREAAGNTWTGTFDAVAGTFTIIPPAEDAEREYWDVGGDFDDASAFGPAGYARLHPFPDESGFQRNTYDFEFNLPRVP